MAFALCFSFFISMLLSAPAGVILPRYTPWLTLPGSYAQAAINKPSKPEPISIIYDEAPEVQPIVADEKKLIALTFDDGPHSELTPMLLDGLKKRGVHATFFMLGSRVKGREHIVARIVEEGHLIGNHGFSHLDYTKLSADSISADVMKAADTIEDAGGFRPWLVRPPYGNTNARVLSALAEPLILWQVDPQDWLHRDAQKVSTIVLDRVRDGDIVLLHDIHESSIQAALIIVDVLTERGYTFVTVEQLYSLRGVDLTGGKRYFRALPTPSTIAS